MFLFQALKRQDGEILARDQISFSVVRNRQISLEGGSTYDPMSGFYVKLAFANKEIKIGKAQTAKVLFESFKNYFYETGASEVYKQPGQDVNSFTVGAYSGYINSSYSPVGVLKNMTLFLLGNSGESPIEIDGHKVDYVAIITPYSKNGDNTPVADNRIGNMMYFIGEKAVEVPAGTPLYFVGASTGIKLENLGISIKTNELGFYPNPATERVNITIASNTDKNAERITVSSEFGGQVADFSGRMAVSAGGWEYPLEIRNYPSGAYFVSVQFEDGTVATGKFIKQ